MLPSLKQGDYVIVLSFFYSLKENDLIVAQHSQYPILIKRIKSLFPTYLTLCSDNPKEGLSSQEMGNIERGQVVGKVLLTIKAP